jgi:hypothetical protein
MAISQGKHRTICQEKKGRMQVAVEITKLKNARHSAKTGRIQVVTFWLLGVSKKILMSRAG